VAGAILVYQFAQRINQTFYQPGVEGDYSETFQSHFQSLLFPLNNHPCLFAFGNSNSGETKPTECCTLDIYTFIELPKLVPIDGIEPTRFTYSPQSFNFLTYGDSVCLGVDGILGYICILPA